MAAYRPIFWLAIFFTGGVALQANGTIFETWVLLCAISALIYLLRRRIYLQKLHWFWLLLALLSGLIYADARWRALPKPWETELDGQRFLLQGTIVGFPREQNQSWHLELDDLVFRQNGVYLSRPGRLRLHLYTSEETQIALQTWSPGDRVEVEAKINCYRPGSNFGEPDWFRLFQRRGIIASGSAETAEARLLARVDERNLDLLLWRVRSSIISAFRGPGQGWILEIWVELLSGLTIGCSNELPEHWDTAFRQAGIIHLLVVSGGHFALLLLLLRRALRLLPLSLRVEQCLLSISIIAYTMLTGAQDSILRAGITALLLLAAELLHRRAEWPSLLMLSMLIQLLLNPFALFEAGFQLSYVSTVGLFLWTPFFERALDFGLLPRAIRRTLAPALAAQIAVVPLGVQLFNQISLVAPLSNLLCTALIMPIQILAVLLLLLTPFGVVATAGLAMLIQLLMEGLVILAEFTANLPGAVWNLPTPGWPLLIFCYAWLLLLTFLPLKLIGLRCRSVLTATILALLLLQLIHPWPRPLELVMLDVGQGDALFIRFPNGATLLVDGGGAAGYLSEVGRRTVLPFLRRQGIQKLDWAIMSHPHADHYQGLLQVIDRFPVRNLAGPPLGHPTATPEDLQQWLKYQPEDRYRALSPGEYLAIDADVSVEVCSVGDLSYNAVFSEINDASVVLRLEYGETVIWLMGDAEGAIEHKLWPRLREQGKQVALKVGHHGGQGGTSSEWVRALTPSVALISVGEQNRYGHPSSDVLHRLESAGSIVVRTDRQGAIRLCSDGIWWEMETVFENEKFAAGFKENRSTAVK